MALARAAARGKQGSQAVRCGWPAHAQTPTLTRDMTMHEVTSRIWKRGWWLGEGQAQVSSWERPPCR